MLYTIENDELKVVVASLGATVNSFIDKKTGIDIVLGFDNEQDYLNNRGPYFGATVGRTANRLSRGTFTLNGETYHITINDGINTLHGGEGISFKEYELKEKTDSSLTFSFFSKDGEDGYPGNLNLEVKYELVNNKLICSYKALCDKDSILSLTNHSYFNLDGGRNNILDHELKIFTNRVSVLDENGMSSSLTRIVDNTPYDFREFRKIGENLNIGDANLSGGGIDHNYVYETMESKKLMCLRNNKLELTISSNLPDCQLYTSNFLGDLNGKNGMKYHNFYGAAIEPQFYPNAINYNDYIKPIINANEEVYYYIEYELNRRG